MARLALRATEIKLSPTLAMNKRAADLKKAGRDIIPLSLGEPDFHTPERVKAAGIAAIRRDFTKYTAADGCSELKAAIAGKLQRDNKLHFPLDQIIVGSGSKIIILATLLSVVEQGDEVVIPAPYWVSYPDLVRLAGGIPIFAPSSRDSGFKVTPEALERALSSRTRAVILNSPNNPSGAVYTIDEMRGLASVLDRYHDVWVVTDEIYEHIVFDNHRAVSFAHAVPEMAERVITINGFSKGYVMTGWRLGFAAGPRLLISAIGDLLSQMHGSPSSIAQAAAMEALEGDQSFLQQNRAVFQDRRDLVVQRINKMPGLSVVPPAGAFYAFVECEGLIGRTSAKGRRLSDDLRVVDALLEEVAVAAVPGEVFGMSSFFRISYALDLPVLRQALDRIETFTNMVQ
jgi:aspartate aminotransferase